MTPDLTFCALVSLLEILRTFSHDELKKFEDFLSSPYFNKHSGVTLLYKHIKKYAPEFKSPKLEMDEVWSEGIDATPLAERLASLRRELFGQKNN